MVRDVYDLSNNVEAKINSAALVLKGIDRLICDGASPGISADDLMELLEIVQQLVETTATYVQEASDATAHITYRFSGAHQRKEGAIDPCGPTPVGPLGGRLPLHP
jgi:hypothetical protein